jgi:hypothetical protein
MSDGLTRLFICSLISKCHLRDYTINIKSSEGIIEVSFYDVYWYSFIRKRKIRLFSFRVASFVPAGLILDITSVSSNKPAYVRGKRFYGCKME